MNLLDWLAWGLGQELGSRRAASDALLWRQRRPWSGGRMLLIWAIAAAVVAVAVQLVRRGWLTAGVCLGVAAGGAALVMTVRWLALRRIHRSAY